MQQIHSSTRDRRAHPRLRCPGVQALPPIGPAGLRHAIRIPDVFAATVLDFSRHGLQTLCHRDDDTSAGLYECALVDGRLQPSGRLGCWELRPVWSLDAGPCRRVGWFIAEPLPTAHQALLRFPLAHPGPLRCLLHPLMVWNSPTPGRTLRYAIQPLATP